MGLLGPAVIWIPGGTGQSDPPFVAILAFAALLLAVAIPFKVLGRWIKLLVQWLFHGIDWARTCCLVRFCVLAAFVAIGLLAVLALGKSQLFGVLVVIYGVSVSEYVLHRLEIE